MVNYRLAFLSVGYKTSQNMQYAPKIDTIEYEAGNSGKDTFMVTKTFNAAGCVLLLWFGGQG